ncbi:MAG TPA: hypothetical protein VLM89_17845 [Phycisphaerae bacterium]|nr:hypothetical protein [Phycisphaerae bacterium]
MVLQAFEVLRQHELVIIRRLRGGPLTEFELAREVAENSNWSAQDSFEHIKEWLDHLQKEGLVWAGKLYNDKGQHIYAAALTRRGKEIIR